MLRTGEYICRFYKYREPTKNPSGTISRFIASGSIRIEVQEKRNAFVLTYVDCTNDEYKWFVSELFHDCPVVIVNKGDDCHIYHEKNVDTELCITSQDGLRNFYFDLVEEG